MTDRPLRIAHLISSLAVGGVQNTLRSTLPLLDRREFAVNICCTYKRGKWAAFFEEREISVHLVPLRGRFNPFDIWKLARWFRENETDIVHTHMYASNISGTLAARLAGVPVIISHLRSDHEWTSPMRGRMDRWMDRFRSGNIAVSESVRQAFFRNTGLPPSVKCVVMHNIRSPLVRCPELRNAVREKHGILPGDFVAGTVARFVPVKRLDLMIRAGRKVLDKHPEIRLLLVGDGKETESLKKLAEALGMGDRVVFAGLQSDLARYYEAMDLLVLCSRTEGCPNVILEAMGFDLPIMATAVGGVPELIKDGENGLLVEPENVDALASGIERVMENPELGRRFTEENRRRVSEYSAGRYIAKLSALYRDLYASRRPGR